MTMFKVGETYRTKGAGMVRIICIDMEAKRQPIVGRISDDGSNEDIVLAYTADGYYYDKYTSSHYDLILEPAIEFDVDDLVEVRDHPTGPWIKRYFARIVNGKPAVWKHGSTSATAPSSTSYITYNQCRAVKND